MTTRLGARLAVGAVVMLGFLGAGGAEVGAGIAEGIEAVGVAAHEAGAGPAEVGAIAAELGAMRLVLVDARVAAEIALLSAGETRIETLLMLTGMLRVSGDEHGDSK